MTFPATFIHLSIRRSAGDVYAYAAEPHNMSKWAAGLSQAPLTKEGAAWIADSPMGRVKIQFAPPNLFGVLDHEVTLPDGTTVQNPLRVQPNGTGSEVVFTLYRQPGVSEQDFAADAGRVKSDLEKLKALLESAA